MKSLRNPLAAAAVCLAAVSFARAANPYQQPSSLEAYLRGQGEMGKAVGMQGTAAAAAAAAAAGARSATAKAAEDLGKVQAMSLDNELKNSKALFDRRKLFDEYRLGKKARAEVVAEASKVEPKSAGAAGAVLIRWPAVFNREAFAAPRDRLDGLFAEREGRPIGPGSELYREVRAATTAMRAELRQQMGELSPLEYRAACRFLDDLLAQVK